MFEQACIIAPGLLGASLGMVMRNHAVARRIHVWARRPEARLQCKEQAWCDAVFDTPQAAAKDCDLCVLCTPVDTIARYARDVAAVMAPGALLTDVGSTKSRICRETVPAMNEGREFVGAHPMAGSDRSGMEHAAASLFEGRICFVTPIEGHNTTEQVERTCAFWRAVGMEVVTTDPERHDEITAWISHLPHALASVLSAELAQMDDNWGKFAGGGLRDTTRIASGHPDLWRAIFRQNREELTRALSRFEHALHAFNSALQNEDYPEIDRLLKKGKAFRDAL